MKPTDEFNLDALLHVYVQDGGEFDEAADGVKLIEDGDWVSEYKDELCTVIYQHVPTSRYFAVHLSRRGSYWSDYEYADPEINEVFPHVVTRTEYHANPQVPA